jgi:hypothetical protein
MIDALIKCVSVTYKCYEMYAHSGEKGATARVLRPYLVEAVGNYICLFYTSYFAHTFHFKIISMKSRLGFSEISKKINKEIRDF